MLRKYTDLGPSEQRVFVAMLEATEFQLGLDPESYPRHLIFERTTFPEPGWTFDQFVVCWIFNYWKHAEEGTLGCVLKT